MHNRTNSLVFALFLAVSEIAAQQTAPPIMGWSSWNTYHVNISDSLILRQTDALVSSGLKEVGYKYINVDDGFFGYRETDGKMHAHPKRFPQGLKGVADYIHSLGLKAGIYSDAGTNTCGSRYDNDKNGLGAGLYGHEYQDALLYFKEWGFDFIKIDYCGAEVLGLEEQRRYTEIRNAISQVGRNDISLNICRWTFPGTWAKDVATSWRISPDIRPRWSSVKHIIELNMPLSAYCRNGHYNDMDMLEISRGLTQTEEETHFGMWCMMSSPLLIGCDMTSIKPLSLDLLKNKELIALNQDPLALQAYPVQHKGDTYILVKDILEDRGKVRAVALYNASDSAAHFSVPLSTLELGGKVRVRDLIHHKNLKAVHDSLTYDVPAHGVLILRTEAEQRLEPSVYEAEWAYLPLFNNLGKDKLRILYANNPHASLGMTVSCLGGSKENVMRWDKVYSEKGGAYKMKVTYVPAIRRALEVSVNGKKTHLDHLQETGDMAEVAIDVELKQGYNTVELGNSFDWAVDVDKMCLTKD